MSYLSVYINYLQLYYASASVGELWILKSYLESSPAFVNLSDPVICRCRTVY